jgi:hypothetical protein
MKTFNTYYTSNSSLIDFIEKNSINSSPNILLQIFTGIIDENYIRDIIDTIVEYIPHIEIIGSSTDGEINDGVVSEKRVVLSFSIFDNTQIITHIVPKNPIGSYQTAKDMIEKFEKNRPIAVAISFTDGLSINGEDYLNGFLDYDRELIISGGMAGDNTNFTKTIIFDKSNIFSSGAVIALLYNPNLIVNTHASFGWVTIGKTLTITKAKDNIVYEIDGMKTIDTFSKYLGENIANQLPRTGIDFPLILKNGNLQVMRAVVGKGDNGELIFAGNLKEGDKVTFGYGNVEMILKAKDSLCASNVLNGSESIFVYSCMARKSLMGRSIKEELEPLSHLASISGFFTYGEFYFNRSKSKLDLLNQTMTILSLRESSSPMVIVKLAKEVLPKSRRNEMLEALAHLISQTTSELEENNIKLLQEIKSNKLKDKQLLQQSRLAQMGEMIAMIAHQWRQPLSAISSASLVLRMKAEIGDVPKDDIIRKTDAISEYAQHLSATIDDFRDFFKPTKEKREIDFCTLIKSALQIIGTSLSNHSIEVSQELNCKSSFVSYPNELKQVILNLIKNSEDIILEKEIENPVISISTYRDKDNRILEIRDNAGGVPEEIIETIFDPYFSTKNNKNGTGLGLYMSKTIVEEHCNGVLSVHNDDKGAVFTISLQPLE